MILPTIWTIKSYINGVLLHTSTVSNATYFQAFIKGGVAVPFRSVLSIGIIAADVSAQARNVLGSGCTFQFEGSGNNTSKIVIGDGVAEDNLDVLLVTSDTDFTLPLELTFTLNITKTTDINATSIFRLSLETQPTHAGSPAGQLTGVMVLRSGSNQDRADIRVVDPTEPLGYKTVSVNLGINNTDVSAGFKFVITAS